MDSITRVELENEIEKQKESCTDVQNIRFNNIETVLNRIGEKIDMLINNNSKYAVLENRIKTIEENNNKRLGNIISIISICISGLLALYVIIPKIPK